MLVEDVRGVLEVTTKKKLILIKENLKWSEALRYCRQNHVDLVLVHSERFRVCDDVVKGGLLRLCWLGFTQLTGVMNIGSG
ncbi:hypothetical protein QQF64_036199 [Cirrhinus molitorella]|uniref:C-type lectin domain-containing protein n=1 Tax=Cirrhinus molitorella TaxID=172907 RepID=A0ABR3NIP7_9TELE